MLQTTSELTGIPLTNHEKKLRFIKALKQFNVKERNFLMRYALSQDLSADFVNDLVNRLQEIGMLGLHDAKAVYWGMDYHLEWINASLLLATGALNIKGGDKPNRREGVLEARVEDVDLMVVMEKSDGTLMLVLIEAKGITSFGEGQLNSKADRLKEIRTSVGADGEWLETVMLIMSPDMSRPSKDTRKTFVGQLNPKDVKFWPSNVPGDENELVWLELKHFTKDLKDEQGQVIALQVRTCTEKGERAINAQAKKAAPYRHWQIEARHIDVKKRDAK
jgi:hypothetical protein